MALGILLALLSFFGSGASASSSPRRAAVSRRAESEALYQRGMERYAAGRLPEALVAFEEALRHDPESRAARVAAERVRAEIAMAGAMKPNPEPHSAEAAAPDGGTLLDRIVGFIQFEDTIGDERELVGRAEALRGRISQLLAEKKLARASHRRFTKDRELHALSRRLA